MVHDARGSIQKEFSRMVSNLKEPPKRTNEKDEAKKTDDVHLVENLRTKIDVIVHLIDKPHFWIYEREYHETPKHRKRRLLVSDIGRRRRRANASVY
jgi:hypothetical protein